MNLLLEYLASVEMLLVFGVASGVLSTFAYIPYIVDTISRRTQPQRASWLIWSVLGSIAFFSQIFEGATSSLWFAGVQVGGTIIVFVLSIWIGQGRYLSKSDYLILAAAGVGLVLWYLTENAAYALAITISISLLGGVATVVKAYREPESETLITWVVSFVASICAILSVGVLDYTLLAYPLYLFTLYLSFIVAILLGRRRDAMGTDSDAHERETVSTPLRTVSIAGLFSGLRKAADAVVVGAACVFTLNWIGVNSSSVHTTTNVLTLRQSPSDSLTPLSGPLSDAALGQPSRDQQARDQQARNAQMPTEMQVRTTGEARPVRLFDTAVMQSSDQPVAPIEGLVKDYLSSAGSTVQANMPQATIPPVPTIHTLAELATMNNRRDQPLFNSSESGVLSAYATGQDATSQNTTGRDATGMIVVAVDRTQPTARPWILHDSDPVAIIAKTQVREWLAADARLNDFTGMAESVAQEQLHTPVFTVPLPIVDTTTAETTVGVSGRFNPALTPALTTGYLQLDEDDPFAVLVVVSDTALLERGDDSAVAHGRLSRGDRVRAIATNGEWYQVRGSGGVQGYIHHSQVLVEALSSLSEQQAG